MDIVTTGALACQWLCVLGMIVVLREMLKRKAKEERKRAERRTHEQGT